MRRADGARAQHHGLRSLTVLGLLVATVLVTSPGVAAEQGLVRLEATIGKSQVLQLKEPFTRVSVSDPNIADVFVITPNQILINGKGVGVTSLVVFYPAKTLFFDLVIQSDIALLNERLSEIAPRDEIRAQPAKDAIILTGKVSSAAVMTAAAEVAAVFAPKGKVINLVGLTDTKPQQVLIQIHVAEVAREALRELGFSIRALGQALQGGSFPGSSFSTPLGTLGAVTESGKRSVVGRSTPDFGFLGTDLFLASGQRDYAAVVRALAERNLLRTLAKPNLITQSGKEARFLSGGQFPYPIAQRENTITIEFKEFGVGLVFTPVVQEDQSITLKVMPEVSSLDFTQGLVASGFAIPVLRKNHAFTTVNLRDGESFAIAGLVNNEVRQSVSKVPLLGDIPILGALFRSTRFQNNETELLFLVTVKLVTPPPPGSASIPDPQALMEPRENEKAEFTLLPGIRGVGEVVERPIGKSNLEAP
ncbi:MAG: pilus assembly protein N-terminal domain-containing protein [Candidatus Rokubacteria bacterium]|nr:pilus assembly protein N-terminal domain-containing protein [Candidatus Rokubacteria bacterium]